MTTKTDDTELMADPDAKPATTPAENVEAEREGKRVSARQPKPGSKTCQLIRMLSRKTGADAHAVSQKLGWLAHTTRAAITGLRKSGYPIAHQKGANGKPGRYRITGPIMRVDG